MGVEGREGNRDRRFEGGGDLVELGECPEVATAARASAQYTRDEQTRYSLYETSKNIPNNHLSDSSMQHTPDVATKRKNRKLQQLDNKCCE